MEANIDIDSNKQYTTKKVRRPPVESRKAMSSENYKKQKVSRDRPVLGDGVRSAERVGQVAWSWFVWEEEEEDEGGSVYRLVPGEVKQAGGAY